MKFGKTFLRSQLPDWSTYYVSYKSLKHLIKKAQKASASTTTTTTTTTTSEDTNTAFFYALDRELEKVNAFFLYKRAELERRIRILQEKYRHAHPSFNSSSPSSSAPSPNSYSDPETDEAFLQALLETKDSIHKTIRYSQLNLTAFWKISKKYDKQLHHHTQKAFLETKVLCLPFANPDPFDNLLDAVEILIRDSRSRLTQTDHSTTATTTTTGSSWTEPCSNEKNDDQPAQRKFFGIQPEQETEIEKCLELDDERALENLIGSIAEKLQASSSSSSSSSSKSNSKDLPPLQLPSSKKPSKLNRTLTKMLYRACAVRAFKCISHLLLRGASLSPHDDINGRTLLHRLAMSGGSFPSTQTAIQCSQPHNNRSEKPSTSISSQCKTRNNPNTAKNNSEDDPTLVSYVLENLPSNIGWSLPDLHGRRPLHYAALNGYANIVKVLIRAHVQGGGGENSVPPFTHPCWCDNDGYTPLFYAILRGHVNVVRILIEEGKIGNVNVLVSAEPPPPSTVIYFPTHLPALPSPAFGSSSQPSPTGSVPSYTNAHHHAYAHTHTPLAVACKLGHVSTAEYFVSKGADVNVADGDGETALHLAAKNGFWKCVAALVSYGDGEGKRDESSDGNGTRDSAEKSLKGRANVEARERMFGWTPLFSAAIEGHVKCVSILLKAGADPLARDSSGWNPHEHAVFRGHMEIAALFRPLIPPYPIPASPFTTPKIEESSTGPFDQAFKNAYKVPSEGGGGERLEILTKTSRGSSPPKKSNNGTTGSDDDAAAERAYGHRYLENQSMIIVTLGTNDARNPVQAVEVQDTRISGSSNWIMPSTSVSLVISASHASGEPAVVDLPIVNETTDPAVEPIVFYAQDVSDVIIKFDLVPTYGSSTRKEILGRAVALLSSVKTPVGKDRTPLAGSVTVPIIGVGGMEVIGRVVFEFLVVKPFVHDKLAVGSLSTYWKSISTKLIGHRGFGANRHGSPSLQLGENTLLSFITAASLGAEYVEFDVQLTKDLVPIVYHDWNVTETGVHIPVNAITLREFLSLRRERSRYTVDDGLGGGRRRSWEKKSLPSSSGEETRGNRRNGGNGRVLRSASMLSTPTTRRESTKGHFGKKEEEGGGGGGSGREKMKGNGPGTVQAPFATLRETFEKVPPSVGFNIEVKYPMIDEAEASDLREAHELNLFVDSILKCVYDHAGQRNVLFSSFHPDVCRMLNFKQPNYPVFFLTDAGCASVADVRCKSMQEAVRFARTSDLLGIVSSSEPVLQAPCLVQTIKEAGLLLFTYGTLNNDVENVRLQRRYGVDAVIVDQVVAVRKGLQGL